MMGEMNRAATPIQIGYEFYRKVDGAWYGYVAQSLDGLDGDIAQEVVEEFRSRGLGSGDNGEIAWTWVKENEYVSRILEAITTVADELGIISFGTPTDCTYEHLPAGASALLSIYHAATGGVTITDHAGFAPFYNQRVHDLGSTGVLPALTPEVLRGANLLRAKIPQGPSTP